MTEKCYSFAFGDVVTPTKKTWVLPHKGAYYVTGYSDGDYSINGCAWFGFKEFELVCRATPQTIRTAAAAGQDDEE